MKILILVPSYSDNLVSTINGVDYHRLLIPHQVLSAKYPNDIDLYQVGEIDSDIIDEVDSIDFLKRFDLVVANRTLSKFGRSMPIINKLKKANVPYIIDMDDDANLPTWHILHNEHKEQGIGEDIRLSIKHSAAITCTHEELALNLNKKQFYIVPNGINPSGQFELKKPHTDRLTFGWSGSVTHFEDILLIHDSLKYLYSDERFKFKFVFGGYNSEDETSNAMLSVLSAKGTAGADKFAIFPTCDVHNYAKFYDLIDVALIPLRDNKFNAMKSNLKLIEAGFKKKAVICSGVNPYLPMLNHGKNCLIAKSKHDWYRNMIKLIQNPNLVADIAQQLYEDVQVQHIDYIADLRKNIYVNNFSRNSSDLS